MYECLPAGEHALRVRDMLKNVRGEHGFPRTAVTGDHESHDVCARNLSWTLCDCTGSVRVSIAKIKHCGQKQRGDNIVYFLLQEELC